MSTFDLFPSFRHSEDVALFVFGSILCFPGVWIVSSGRDDSDDNYGSDRESDGSPSVDSGCWIW